MLTRAQSYEALCDGFAWNLPQTLNMAVQVCDSWLAQDADRLALVDLTTDARRDVTFGALAALSFRVQAALTERGVQRGDRVGVLLGQSPLCAAAHIAIWRMGAISVPLFRLFEQAALRSRLTDAGVLVVVTDEAGRARVAPLGLQALGAGDLPDDAAARPAVPTGPEDPAVLIYTSGTTGPPKGALHGHRVLTGHLPGVEISHDFLGQPGDVLWTPADWAWIGGLFDVLMPGLALGVPVVAGPPVPFSTDLCHNIIGRGAVRNVFFPPTALRMLKASGAQITGLRSVASGGEPLGDEMRAWALQALRVQVNEFYGQTECNMVASSCARLFAAQSGALGRAAPGFDVQVIDETGQPTGAEGDIAVRKGAASMMLRYFDNPEATAAKYRGDWLVTGDRGVIKGGYIHFVGREDDVITSAGYRIGPSEIEDCLLTHPSVATVGVVGKPCATRTQIVKAYVVLKSGAEAQAEDLQTWVKTRLARHCYPREIDFVDALPMTVTGKVIRRELKARAEQEAAS